MIIINSIPRVFCLAMLFFATRTFALPQGFVYLKDIDPTIIQEMRYAASNNFIGRPVKGYEASECILTKETALALAKIQEQLEEESLGLKVYDCYRPETAVKDFIQWSRDPSDQKMKQDYYPKINKADFFILGYVAEKSGHARGSTVDLTLVHFEDDTQKPEEIDMGTTFDYMDEASHTFSKQVEEDEMENRLYLRDMMEEVGFIPYDNEWWHFTLKNEPFPAMYFDFPVQKPSPPSAPSKTVLQTLRGILNSLFGK